ncbi:MAG: HU family DNA-binding protein [Rhodospirillales bacterium]|nr:HU family DNA-binding protein [Rhodospirillales bacterium]MDE0380862.1 HU family DNA-binding protein [Rhodospirillales bacterium]
MVGFGRFTRTERPARQGRNPRTGESIAIGPSAGVSFKAG